MSNDKKTEDEKDEAKARAARARADALTPERRKTIAMNAAAARWGPPTHTATHRGSFKEDFGIEVDCYVLDDAQKSAVISQRGMGAALGLGQIGGRLPAFIKGRKIAPYVERELAEKLANPLIFQWAPPNTNQHPVLVHGHDVTILIDLCKAIVRADADGKLIDRQKNIVRQAQVIQSASAKAGIKSLVYALAGYDQTKDEVIAAFKFYVREEARQYEKEFPDQLYAEWIRLYDLREPPRGKNWKHKDLTVKHVYTPLARSNGKILALTRFNRARSGDRWAKLHSFLTEIGVKALRTHLGQLLGIAQVSEDRARYEKNVERIFGPQLSLGPDF